MLDLFWLVIVVLAFAAGWLSGRTYELLRRQRQLDALSAEIRAAIARLARLEQQDRPWWIQPPHNSQ